MNYAEKILASHAGLAHIESGQIINVPVDMAMGNDLSTIFSLKIFKELGAQTVFDPDKIVIVPDHFVPNKDVQAAQMTQAIRQFVAQQAIKNYFEVGRGGIAHVVLPQKGFVRPGSLMIGGDSHTCTYGALGAFAVGVGSTDLAVAWATGRAWLKVPEVIRIWLVGRPPAGVYGKDIILYLCGKVSAEGARYKVVEFAGPALQYIPQPERFTLCNMTIEMGAKTGIIVPDRITLSYLEKVCPTNHASYPMADPDAAYVETIEVNCSELEPFVAKPTSPDNIAPLREVLGVPLDEIVIGSCTNGWIEDLRICAQILKGHQIHPNVRVIVLPGSQQVYLEAAREGIVEILTEAGAAISPSTCGACIGGHMGVLGPDETCLSTTSRNFSGRMGHPTAKVYLSNPAVAAASAITGKITDPREFLPSNNSGPVFRSSKRSKENREGRDDIHATQEVLSKNS